MNAYSFDTHRMVKRLRDAGFSDVQAETFTDVLREARQGDFTDLATKQDLKDQGAETAAEFNAVRTEIKDLRTETKSEFAAVRAEIKDLRTETKSEFAAVRAEIKDLRTETKTEFTAVRAEMKNEFAAVRADMEILRRDLTIRLGGMIAAGVAFLTAIKYFG